MPHSRSAIRLGLYAVLLCASFPSTAADSALEDLVRRAASLEAASLGSGEPELLAVELRRLLGALGTLEAPATSVERALLRSYLETRRFEIEGLRMPALLPGSHLRLGTTEALARRPCAHGDQEVRQAVRELEVLPELLARGAALTETPARWWTESAISSTRFASQLLGERAPTVCVDDPELRKRLVRALAKAGSAVVDFGRWLVEEILPISERSPTWSIDQFQYLAGVHERLDGYQGDRILALLVDEERRLAEELSSRRAQGPDLAGSGPPAVRTDWGWEAVLPALERHARQLQSHLAGSSELGIDFRPVSAFEIELSPGAGAPRVRFVVPGQPAPEPDDDAYYYPVRQLPEKTSAAELEELLALYTPELCRARAYRGLLFAATASERADSVDDTAATVSRLYRSPCVDRAYELYLGRWLRDQEILTGLSETDRFAGELALLELRMVETQMELARLRLALGEIGPEEVVESYRRGSGLSEVAARAQIRRASMSPLPPGCGFLGERALLDMRAELLGRGRSMRQFHADLWRLGGSPLPIVREQLLSRER